MRGRARRGRRGWCRSSAGGARRACRRCAAEMNRRSATSRLVAPVGDEGEHVDLPAGDAEGGQRRRDGGRVAPARAGDRRTERPAGASRHRRPGRRGRWPRRWPASRAARRAGRPSRRRGRPARRAARVSARRKPPWRRPSAASASAKRGRGARRRRRPGRAATASAARSTLAAHRRVDRRGRRPRRGPRRRRRRAASGAAPTARGTAGRRRGGAAARPSPRRAAARGRREVAGDDVEARPARCPRTRLRRSRGPRRWRGPPSMARSIAARSPRRACANALHERGSSAASTAASRRDASSQRRATRRGRLASSPRSS